MKGFLTFLFILIASPLFALNEGSSNLFANKLSANKELLHSEAGATRTYYPNGKVECELQVKKSKLNGRYRCYHEDGKLAEEGVMEDNLAQGEVKAYDLSGKFYCNITLKNGIKEGDFSCFYKNGKKRDEATYKQNKLDGLTKHYGEDGLIEAEITFKNGLAEGSFKEYEKGRLFRETSFKKGRRDGLTKIYSNGSLALELTFRSDKMVFGKCATGKVLSKDELTMLEKGEQISCK